MLYLDGLSLSKLKEELNDTLSNRKCTRVFQYSPLSLSIFLGKLNFYVSAIPNLPIAYIAEEKENAPDKPMNFSLSLRKYLVGAILTKVEQYNFDRILLVSFEKINELGVKQKVTLIIELMGKHSNIILVDEDFMILDLLKKFSLEENKLRLLMSGAKYEFPTITEKKSPLDITEDEFTSLKEDDLLVQNIDGIGKLTTNNIDSFGDFKSLLENQPTPTIYSKDSIIKYGTIFNFSMEGYKTESFDTINTMINNYITRTLSSEQFSNQKRTLSKVVEKEIKKNKKTIKHIKKDIIKYSDFEKYKKIGDILAANLYALKGYEKSVELFDFYDNKNIEIQLNPQKSPNENLDNYYNLYNKYKRGRNHSNDRLSLIESEIKYLETIKSFLELANDKNTLSGIEEELISNKYLKKVVKPSKKKKKKVNKITPSTVEIHGFTGYYGKNNIENDYVTFKIADRHDVWFHGKDVPGCHFILKGDLEDLTDEILQEVSKIVASNSKVSLGQGLQIDYTLKKYVKKISGGKLGAVTYTHENSTHIKVK